MNCELVPENVSETDLKEEVNRRTAKCGYTTRYGECPYKTKIQTTVPFGEQRLNIWPRNNAGDLIDESNKRAAGAGYCSRSGEPLRATKIQTSIPFGKGKLNLWPRDENDNLID